MRRAWSILGTMAVAVASAACGGNRAVVDLAASAPPESSTTASVPTTTAAGSTTATRADPTTTTTTASPRTTTTTTRPLARTGRVPVPRTTATTIAPPPVETALPATVPTTPAPPPLPVPELFDVRQGLGTPCDVDHPPPGCFFFVYATPATRGWDHLLYSDAPFRVNEALRTSGSQCGTANPHHPGRESCHWYIGPVHERTAGQGECFWLTTIEGTRESEPSNRVCLTWTDSATT